MALQPYYDFEKVKRPTDLKQRLKLAEARALAAETALRSIRATTLEECAKVARLKFAGGNLSVIGNLIADDINSLAQKEIGND